MDYFKNQFFKTMGLAFLILSFSCSEESLNNTETESPPEAPFSFSQNIIENSNLIKSVDACVNNNQTLLQHGTISVTAGSKNYKTLSSNVSQTSTELIINASVDISMETANLPSNISIYINGDEKAYQEVGYGSITYKVTLPYNWTPGDQINYRIVQKAFLQPIELSGTVSLVRECPISINIQKYGGIVAYLFQEDEEGYQDGRNHGLIMATSELSESNWETAMEACENLELNGYNDWILPSSDHLIKIINNLFLEPEYYLSNGFWSSTEASESTSYSSFKYGFSSSVTLIESPKDASFSVRPVRIF